MSGMIKGFNTLGYKQGVIAGIDKNDSRKCFSENISFYPVIYNTDKLPSFFEGLPLVVIEALASGCNVITTNIPGVSEWIGEDINTSGKIKYVNLPDMKDIGLPLERDLLEFENNVGLAINEMIENILQFNTRNKVLNMNDKTWLGLCKRLDKFMNSRVKIYSV
nr:glycosyltransferase [[Eubacterium] tenue]